MSSTLTPGIPHAVLEEAGPAGVGIRLDVDGLQASGDLLLLDAEETLARCMVDGMPGAGRFNAMGTDVMERTWRGRTDSPIRAYGEMVDVLWKQGQSVAAVRLEMFWGGRGPDQALPGRGAPLANRRRAERLKGRFAA